MNHSVRACMLLIGILTASASWAGCSVSPDLGATTRLVSPAVQADADLVVSMSMVPKLTHVDYHTAAQRQGCDLGPLTAEDGSYELWGSDAPGRQRKALPTRKGQPIALIIPIFDMVQAIDKAKAGKEATIEGYMLAIVTQDDLTGWRLYTAMPDVKVLKHDMAEALEGGAEPIFRNTAGGKTAIFVPKG
jgi:hypothetical protein